MPAPKSARAGGPGTVAGRAVTARNALKSGAYAVQVVLPGEDAQQFAELERQLVQDFEPVGMAEAAMVHDLAVLTWKKLRIDRVEHSVMMELALMPVIEKDLEKAFGPGWRPGAMSRVKPLQPVTQGEYDNSAELLEQVRALRLAPARGLKATTVRRKWPLLCAALQVWADDYLCSMVELVEGFPIPGQPGLPEALDVIAANHETVLWLWDNHDKLGKAIQRVRDSRQFAYMKTCDNDITLRSFNDISRSFYRALSALRHQQDWRMRRSAISVDDVSPNVDADRKLTHL